MSDAESIFFAALDKPAPAERDAYLAAACGDDADLRRRVERLLAAAPQVGSFLEQPAAGTGASEPPADRHGERVGPYKLLQRLGEGGMGEVWMAEQDEPVKRRVAVKLIKAGMDSRQVIARFEAERQALALMDHPNIAKVFDAGTTAAGRPYFVMELVKGVPLTAYCDDNHLTPRERLELFVPVCQAVQHAHQKGVIHRDLKPSNVLVALYDGRPVPKVIDFGVAKALHRSLTERTMFTEVGSVVGTLEYMSPEQAELNNLDIDTRSDVYSLGVMLYELLTGSRPLDAKRLQAAGFAEMLRIIREEEPPKPSTKLSGSGDRLPGISAQRRTEPHKLSRLVRGDLDWIVMKALEKDRGRRYETANGFAADVQRYLADEPVLAGPPRARYRFGKFVRRNKGRAVAAALVLLALVAGTALATLGMIAAERQRQIALAEAARAAAERERAEAAAAAEGVARAQAEKRLAQVQAANDLLGSVFADLDPKGAQPGGKPLQAVLGERLDRATAEIAGDAIGDPLAAAKMQMKLGVSQLHLGYPEKAIQLFTSARAALTARLGPDHPDTLASLNHLAAANEAAGKLALAVPLYEEAFRLRKAKLGPDHPDTLASMNGLAAGYRAVGRLADALPIYEEALRHSKAKLGPDHPTTIQGMSNVAEGYHAAGRVREALPLFEEALRLLRARLGPDHPNTLTGMNNLAASYNAAGKFDAAVRLFEETLRVRTARLGPDHPDTLTGMSNLAGGYLAIARFNLAVPLYEEALQRMRARLGVDHPATLKTMHGLAVAYRDTGRLDTAIALFEETLVRLRAKLGPDHGLTHQCMSDLAVCLVLAGKLDHAEAMLRQLIALRKPPAVGESSQHAGNLATLGLVLLRQRRWADAEALLRESLAYRTAKEPDAWTTFATRTLLGNALLGQQKYADAEPLLVSGYEGLKQRVDKMPLHGKARLPEVAGRLAQLYDATGKPDAAAKWLDEMWAWADTP